MSKNLIHYHLFSVAFEDFHFILTLSSSIISFWISMTLTWICPNLYRRERSSKRLSFLPWHFCFYFQLLAAFRVALDSEFPVPFLSN